VSQYKSLENKNLAMKKILFLGLILALFAAAATAQQTHGNRLQHQREFRSLQRTELNHQQQRRLHRNEARYELARKKAYRDGRITPSERRQLRRLKEYQRHELYRLRHKNRHLI
jgi:Ni/Co efflux regulator RcnB